MAKYQLGARYSQQELNGVMLQYKAILVIYGYLLHLSDGGKTARAQTRLSLAFVLVFALLVVVEATAARKRVVELELDFRQRAADH